MIRGCQIKFHQFKDRLAEALRLSTGQSIDGLEGGHCLDRQIRIGQGRPAPAGQFAVCPVGDCLVTNPDRQSSSLSERAVLIRPVADAERGILFHGRKNLPRNSHPQLSLRFLQQRQ